MNEAVSFPFKWSRPRTPEQQAYLRQRGFRLRVDDYLAEARDTGTPRGRRLEIARKLLRRHADLLTVTEIVELTRLRQALDDWSDDDPAPGRQRRTEPQGGSQR